MIERQRKTNTAESYWISHSRNRIKLSLENPDDYPPLLLCAIQFLQQNTVYLFLPPEQHTLLNELLLELQTLVQGPHLALHVRSLSLSQIPGGGRDRVDTHTRTHARTHARTHTHTHTRSCHYPEKTPATPAMVTEMVQSNFLRAAQCSRNPNGKNRRVNKTGADALWLN